MLLSINTPLFGLCVHSHSCLTRTSFIQFFPPPVRVCPLRVVTVTRKCIKWGQLLVIGTAADSLELSSTTGPVTTRVHVHKTAIHIIRGFTVAACLTKMLFSISAQVTDRDLMFNTPVKTDYSKVLCIFILPSLLSVNFISYPRDAQIKSS